jgi:hypothetical protein
VGPGRKEEVGEGAHGVCCFVFGEECIFGAKRESEGLCGAKRAKKGANGWSGRK